MERELWAEVSKAVGQVDARWRESGRFVHRTAMIARVYLYAVWRDRSIRFACEADNWDSTLRPKSPKSLKSFKSPLPDQSTMSRRTRTATFDQFLAAVGQRLAGKPSAKLIKRLDGKPLPIAAHSSDRDATWGRGAGGVDCRGYKLHAIWAQRAMPEQWALAPLNVDERVIARRLIKRLEGGAGYVLADGLYEGDPLHRLCAAVNHQLVANRRRPGTGLGHHPISPQRRRCIEMLEPPAGVNDFGPTLHRDRAQIDRQFGHLTSFGGGLSPLPSWVRRIWRVRSWVHGKLLINAARIRVRERTVGA
jgi:hypothetical protein